MIISFPNQGGFDKLFFLINIMNKFLQLESEKNYTILNEILTTTLLILLWISSASSVYEIHRADHKN